MDGIDRKLEDFNIKSNDHERKVIDLEIEVMGKDEAAGHEMEMDEERNR